MASTTSQSTGFRSILAACDFSSEPDLPLRRALAIARHYGAKFCVAHVAQREGYSIGCAGAVRSALDTARRDSEQLNQELLQSGALAGLHYEFIVREGDTWEQWKQLIHEKQVDLFVTATDFTQTRDSGVPGTAAEQLFRDADCAVLSVGPGSNLGSLTEQDEGFDDLLYVTDFGAASLYALPHAVSLTNMMGARLTLLHVLPAVPVGEAVRLSVAPEDMTQMQEDARLASFRRLEELTSSQATLAVRPDFIVTFGSVGQQILRVAELRKVDVIIMGLNRVTRVETGASLPWATAYEVMNGANCPVLTIRS